MIRIRLAALLVGFCLAASGCGYSSGSLLRQDVTTVAVPVFENLTFRRGLEVDVTRALKSEIRLKTHLRQVSEGAAETVLRGTITEVDERVLSEGDDDRILEESVTVTVRVTWTRLSDGEVLLELPRVRGSAEIASARGEDIAEGARVALRELAERIVLLMEDRSW